MTDKCFKYWEIAGFFLIFSLGALMHFLYVWSGESTLAAILFPVNESVWEHLKLVFLPSVGLLFLELIFCRRVSPRSLVTGKTAGIYLMCAIIVGGFYFYTLFLEENLSIDIFLMALAILAGQLTSYKIAKSGRTGRAAATLSVVLLIVLWLAFLIFTFTPPRLDLFEGAVSGTYGV